MKLQLRYGFLDNVKKTLVYLPLQGLKTNYLNVII